MNKQPKVAKRQPKAAKKVAKVPKRKMASKITKKAYIQQQTENLLAETAAAKTDPYAPYEFFTTFKKATLVIPEFQQVITHPIASEERKRAMITDVLTHLGADKPTVAFYTRLAIDDRLGLAKDALTKYRKMAADANKEQLATITSANPLTPAQVQSVTKALEGVVHKGFKLRVFTAVDPQILGGLVIAMDEFYQDLSMSSGYQMAEQKIIDATAV
jgi:ATP synthase F1 delta subunit